MMVQCKIPYARFSKDESVFEFVVGGGRLERPAQCSDALWAIMQRCWQTAPAQRPTFAKLLPDIALAFAAAGAKRELGCGCYSGLLTLHARTGAASPSHVAQAVVSAVAWNAILSITDAVCYMQAGEAGGGGVAGQVVAVGV